MNLHTTRLAVIAVMFLMLAPLGCGGKKTTPSEKQVPTIAFIQAIQDETINEAKKGFLDALAKGGFSDTAKTIKVLDRNAQGDLAVLSQIIDQAIADKVRLIAANTTVAMISSVQKTKEIPIFMMVAPSPTINGLTETDASGKNVKAPKNLSGVYETLTYIDSNLVLIKGVFPKAKRIGVIYNSAEQNSMNAITRMKALAKKDGFEIEERAISSSNETQQAIQSLIDKKIDVFFGLPDNLLFASFETVVKECETKKVPILTSEAGLVKRGALFGYGADFYQWGYQAGEQVAKYLAEPQDKSGDGLREQGYPLQTVGLRKLVHNPDALKAFGLEAPKGSVSVK
jgi:putative tryptophan/tyrosine transport system substrate-binding protein